MATRPFNADFAATDKLFQKACELAKVQPTKRQASKWQRAFGSAWAMRQEAFRFLNPHLF